jgi:hypothetical protein
MNKLQHIMKLPMNIAYKDCFTLWVYRYVHTIRLPMKELLRYEEEGIANGDGEDGGEVRGLQVAGSEVERPA